MVWATEYGYDAREMINNYDSSKTEWDNMMINGYNKIYDSGNKVFVREV